jgi:hypothetical protein
MGANTMSVLADEPATLTVKSIPNLNIRMYGFVETDFINDSTQGLLEEADNATIAKSNTVAGSHGQTLMGVRNSRLGFDITMPETDSLKTEAVMEMDFYGNQGLPVNENSTIGINAAGTASSKDQAERDFFNNPTFRIRHAYLNLTYDEVNAKFGQYWSLFGWQPYYFPSEPIVQPAVGQLYRRFPQFRVTDTHMLGNNWQLESAIDAAKPSQMDSGMTDYHAGIRIADNDYKAVCGMSSGDSMTALSLAASWVWVPIYAGTSGQLTGTGYALDMLIPILPSSDGKDKANNLSLTAEYSNASGDGGLELAGATSGIGQVSGDPIVGFIDSGIAGLNLNKQAELIQFETLRGNLTYVLPNPKWAVSAGYAQTRCDNIGDFSVNAAGTGISQYQYYYGSAFYSPLKWIRFALEYAEFHDTYTSVTYSNAQDNRTQFTTYVTF